MKAIPPVAHELHKLLQYALGIRPEAMHWGYRNYFCAYPGPDDHREWEWLVGQGLATRGVKKEQLERWSSCRVYHVTETGCLAAGMTPDQIAQMEDD